MLDNAQLHIISGAGHEINLETPEKMAKVLRPFFAGGQPCSKQQIK
ncbi:MAG: hypothetical protein NC392_12555 [Roseburia sp.]|nr:hypothetical protein [Roseburia sp.]